MAIEGLPVSTSSVLEWEAQRRRFLAPLIKLLEAENADLDAEPIALVPVIHKLVAGQDYAEVDQDDWLWLHTALAAYVAKAWSASTPHAGNRGRTSADHVT
jgi:hypothetical protein